MLNRNLLVALGLTAAMALTFGCMSIDRHVYRSNPHRPTTVTVVNSQTKEPLWSYDVPAGYKLIVDFNNDITGHVKTSAGAAAPTEMNWQLARADLTVFQLHDKFPPEDSVEAWDVVSLPGVPVMMKVTYRPAESGPIRTEEFPALDTEVTAEPVEATGEAGEEAVKEEALDVEIQQPDAATTEPATDAPEDISDTAEPVK